MRVRTPRKRPPNQKWTSTEISLANNDNEQCLTFIGVKHKVHVIVDVQVRQAAMTNNEAQTTNDAEITTRDARACQQRERDREKQAARHTEKTGIETDRDNDEPIRDRETDCE